MSRQPETARVDYAGVVQSCLMQLVGPERSGPAAQRALAEIAMHANGSSGPEIAVVRKVAQSVGLDALDVEARRLGRRIAAAAAGKRKCARVARRLRDRSKGLISASELDAFYRHLERCQSCAAIAGRFEAGEWYLQVELGAAARPARVAELPAAEVAVEVEVEEVKVVAAAEAQVDEVAAPDVAVEDVPAAQVSPADAPPPPPGTPSAPAWRPRRKLQGLILALAAIAFVAILRSSPPGSKHVGSGAPRPTTGSPAVNAGGVTTTTETITPTHDGFPFVVAGTRFAVLLNPSQPWTDFTRTVSAGPRERWVLIAVRASNLSQAPFDPTKIAHRLTASGGAGYLPNPRYGTGADVPRPAAPTAPGTLTQTELAFQVPETARGLRLAFAPAPGQQVLVTIA